MQKVKWTLWEPSGNFHNGDMTVREAQYWLGEFGQEAKEMVKEACAEHVVYGVKRFDENGALERVQFYLLPMNDADFHKMVGSGDRTEVYAVHAR